MTDPRAASEPLLSLCIATLNRAPFLRESLQSIAEQIVPGVEIVILDGGSRDDTEEVVRTFQARIPDLRYTRLAEKGGVDKDFDLTVERARGRYCWLFTDDDPLKPGAIPRLLEVLRSREPGLVIVNAEVWNPDLTELLEERRIPIESDETFSGEALDRLATTVGGHLSFIGCVVIERSRWLARDRTKYYGTEFVHLGVIFQRPLDAAIHVIADPLIRIRYGNAQWVARWIEIWAIKWPTLIWGFDTLSEASKRALVARRPLTRPRFLLMQRGMGRYDLAVYRRFRGNIPIWARLPALAVACLPRRPVQRALIRHQERKGRTRGISLYDLRHQPGP